MNASKKTLTTLGVAAMMAIGGIAVAQTTGNGTAGTTNPNDKSTSSTLQNSGTPNSNYGSANSTSTMGAGTSSMGSSSSTSTLGAGASGMSTGTSSDTSTLGAGSTTSSDMGTSTAAPQVDRN